MVWSSAAPAPEQRNYTELKGVIWDLGHKRRSGMSSHAPDDIRRPFAFTLYLGSQMFCPGLLILPLRLPSLPAPYHSVSQDPSASHDLLRLHRHPSTADTPAQLRGLEVPICLGLPLSASKLSLSQPVLQRPSPKSCGQKIK